MDSKLAAQTCAAVSEMPGVSGLTVDANNLTEEVVLEAQKHVPQAGMAGVAMRAAP